MTTSTLAAGVAAEPAAKRIHPLVAGAAVSIIALSLTGIAAMAGWIGTPSAKPAPEPAAVLEAAPSKPALSPQPPLLAAAPGVQPAGNAQPHRPAASARPSGPESRPAEDMERPDSPPPARTTAPCRSCAVVESVRAVQHKGEGSGVGAVSGGVLGGVVGHQFGGGSGRDAMTVLGAVGGAVAGHQIERNMRTVTRYQMTVRFEDGSRRRFSSSQPYAWRAGDPVRVVDGRVQAR
jgi:outer membrane lipoprotein SlyB